MCMYWESDWRLFLYLLLSRCEQPQAASSFTDGVSFTCSALVTIGQTSLRYFSRYLGNSVAKLLSSRRLDWCRQSKEEKERQAMTKLSLPVLVGHACSLR